MKKYFRLRFLLLFGLTGIVLLWSSAPPRYSLQRVAVRLSSSFSDNNLVARKLAEILAEQVNAQHFGAVPDDGNDDVAAIRKYRDWSRRFGRNMYFTEGTYTLMDSVHHPGSNIDVYGRGQATRFELRNASMRCGWFLKNVNLAGLHDMMIESIIPAGTSTNMSGIELQGNNFFNRFTNLRIACRNKNPGTNRGIYVNASVSTGFETLWSHFLNCFVEHWKYGLDAGQGGFGNTRITAGNYTQSDENIRLKGAGGSQIFTSVGGFVGQIGIHMMDSCRFADINVFSEMITGASHIAAVKIDAGADQNRVFLSNGGDTPAVIDAGKDNEVQIVGAAPSAAGFYSTTSHYRKIPWAIFDNQSTQNFLNGGIYLRNTNDSTAGANKVNQRIVFESRVTPGGPIAPTGGVSSFRRSPNSNTGGIRIDAVEYGPLTVAQFDVFGQYLNYGDVVVREANKGVILTAPNGTCYRLTVSNAGAATFTSVTCPPMNK